MSELRDLVIDAHGGIARWNKLKTIEADMSITGGLWARKGWPDALKNVHVTAATGNQWISYRPFVSESMRSSCTPDHTVIETLDGKPVKDRRNPRAAFDGHTVETPWDDLNLAYFSGYAMWNYLTTPFIFALRVSSCGWLITSSTTQFVARGNGRETDSRIHHSADLPSLPLIPDST